jgi:hypothetical protein
LPGQISGGIATAESIPNAKLTLFDGMGHGLPTALWSEIADLITALVHQAEAVPLLIIILRSNFEGKVKP